MSAEGEPWEKVLADEFGAEDGSFLLRLRIELVWDKAAYARLVTAMRKCCQNTTGQIDVPRWIASGFWYVPRFTQNWTTHPSWENDAERPYYETCYEELDDLAELFFGDLQTDSEGPAWSQHEINAVRYVKNVVVSAERVADLFARSGIKRPVDDLERIEKMLRHANLTWTAWDGNKLIGIARSLTDFSWCCYLSDLAVDAAYQKAGVGRELIRLSRDTVGENVTFLLLSAPGAMDYYPRVGLGKAENAWVIPRKN